MSKKATYEAVVAAVAALKLDEKTMGKLTPVLNEYLAPKSGGATVDISKVTKKDDKGNITHVQCAVSGVWLPASLEFFYEDKSEKPRIVGVEGKGLKRTSKQAESIFKKFNKANKASQQAITDDILALDLSSPENVKEVAKLKAKLEKIKTEKPDYSSVSANPVKTEE